MGDMRIGSQGRSDAAEDNSYLPSMLCSVVLCCGKQFPIIPSIFLFDSVELRRPKIHRIKPINVRNMSSEVLDALSYPLNLLKRKGRETDEVETYIPVINGSVITSHMDAASSFVNSSGRQEGPSGKRTFLKIFIVPLFKERKSGNISTSTIRDLELYSCMLPSERTISYRTVSNS